MKSPGAPRLEDGQRPSGGRRPPPSLAALRRDTRSLAKPARALLNHRYLKCGPGEYGEGDRFLGLTLPDVRALTRTYRALSLADVSRLLESKWHEERLLALLILVHQFQRGTPDERRTMFRLYIRQRARINNWDLVDCSAAQIVGAHAEGRDRVLATLMSSSSLWDRRIALLATFHDIKQGKFDVALSVATRLLGDRQDLIHKAMGWMLREIGKRDQTAEETFLQAHAHMMPRTALRYAVERFPEPLRRRYLAMRAEHRQVSEKHLIDTSRRTSARRRGPQAE